MKQIVYKNRNWKSKLSVFVYRKSLSSRVIILPSCYYSFTVLRRPTVKKCSAFISPIYALFHCWSRISSNWPIYWSNCELSIYWITFSQNHKTETIILKSMIIAHLCWYPNPNIQIYTIPLLSTESCGQWALSEIWINKYTWN